MVVGNASVAPPGGLDGPSWYCLHCDSHHPMRPGEEPPRRCPTLGCKRPDGFGKYAAATGPRVENVAGLGRLLQ